MTQQENPLFQGFQPQVIEGGVAVDHGPFPAAEPGGKKKRKSGKKKKATGAAQVAVVAETSPAPAKPPRKPRTSKAPSAKRTPKFELQAILAATAGLKEADMPGFEKGLNLLLDVNAAGRARLLAAWAKVFS